jgi:hypothetical protein
MIGLELFNGDTWLGAHHEIAVVTLAMIAYWIAQPNIAQLDELPQRRGPYHGFGPFLRLLYFYRS